MDLIQALTSQLGVDASQAQAIAGSTLGAVRGAVAEKAGPAKAAELDSAIPELPAWQAAATQALGGSGAGGMLGGAGGMLGGMLRGAGGATGAAAQAQQAAQLATLVSKLGLDPKMAAMIAPMVLSFLRERLPAGLLDTVLKAAPFLTGGGSAKPGGLGGLLG